MCSAIYMLRPDSQPDPLQSRLTGLQPLVAPQPALKPAGIDPLRSRPRQVDPLRYWSRVSKSSLLTIRSLVECECETVRRRKENAIARKTSRDGGAVGHTRRGIPLRTE